MSYKHCDYIMFGGDYNPDQWDEKTIRKDMELLKEAHVNTVVLPVFSWAKLEPAEGVYQFDWLDAILDLLDENGIQYILATPTSAQPAWMSKKYPEILPVDIDGRKRTHGMRAFFCMNSSKYRQEAQNIAKKMAERYGQRKGLSGWHVANEYGTSCYCNHCQNQFRSWLKRRYGTIEALNNKWMTAFWGRTFSDFDEVMLPTHLNDDASFAPAIELDYQRFKTDSTIACFENEAKVLKAARPDLPVFTNISGFIKKLDQFKMVPHMDVAGFDNYPAPKDPSSLVALKLDIMRAAHDGASFFVTEQSPAQQNWQPYNKLKRPGEVRRIAYQGLAHGADTSLFFQMRQSAAGQEKLHGALISRTGNDQTRTFKEMTALGAELNRIGDRFIGARTQSEIGVLFDWENWWALENCSGPSKDKNYLAEVHTLYRPFYKRNVSIDILKVSSDFSKYRVIIAPCLYMLKGDTAKRLTDFVRRGGILLTNYLTGYADENDRCIFGAYPGTLRDVMGIWVEETDALYPDEENSIHEINSAEEFNQNAKEGKHYRAEFLCDLIHPIQAKVEAVFEKDFYRGYPAVTVNQYGKGQAWYLASRFEEQFLDKLAGRILDAAKIKPLLVSSGEVEITQRVKENRKTLFVINQGTEEAEVMFQSEKFMDILSGNIRENRAIIKAGDVWILASQDES